MSNPFAPQQGQQQPAQQGGGNPFAGGQQQPAAPPQQQQAPQQAPPQQPQGGGGNPFAGGGQAQQGQSQPGGFDQPGRGSGDAITGQEWRDWVGALVLFEPKEFRQNVPTKNGEADAVLADVHVIDVDGGPIFKERAFVFPPALVTATKEAAKAGGGRILGRLNSYTTQAGRDTVELVDHTAQDAQTAARYLQWRAQQSMQQPTGGQAGGEPPY